MLLWVSFYFSFSFLSSSNSHQQIFVTPCLDIPHKSIVSLVTWFLVTSQPFINMLLLTFHPYHEEEETVIGDDEFRAPFPMLSITMPPPAIICHEPYYVPPILTCAPSSPPFSIFGTSVLSALAMTDNHSNIWRGLIPPLMVIYDPTMALESTTGWYSSNMSLGVPSTIADDQFSRFLIEWLRTVKTQVKRRVDVH